MKALFSIASVLVLLLFSSFRQQPGATGVMNHHDTTTIVTFKVKFVRQIIGPMCGFLYLPERNMFKTVVSFRHGQLDENFIEVEYGDCKHYQFRQDLVYEIKAVYSPLRQGYINVITSPEPEKLIAL